MAAAASTPWIHIGECTFCADGLCRVRICGAGEGAHLFAMCDECDAQWVAPDTSTPKTFPDPEQPLCPVCGAKVHDKSRLASVDDIAGSDWEANVIVVQPQCNSENPDEQKSVHQADASTNGTADRPTTNGDVGSVDVNDSSPDEDVAYGQDEPRPGC